MSLKGRDPEGKGTVIPQFEAPNNLTPAEVGTILDEKADNKDITANIINLAVSGYIKIIRKEKEKFMSKSVDYVLEKLKEGTDLKNFDKKLMKYLFSSGKNSVKLSEISQNSLVGIDEIKKEIYSSVLNKGYFHGNPNAIRGKYLLLGAATVIFGFIAGSWMESSFAIAGFAISGVIISLFSYVMPAKTLEGVETIGYILGLKLYMEVAEKDRMNFHNAPEKNPEHFEKLLPYAIVLGVEKKWAKQFEGIYNKQPDWYSDSSGGAFNALIFASSLNSFSNSANYYLSNASYSSMSSASHGGSGFSGGGSGGGFGGGGGGSW